MIFILIYLYLWYLYLLSIFMILTCIFIYLYLRYLYKCLQLPNQNQSERRYFAVFAHNIFIHSFITVYWQKFRSIYVVFPWRQSILHSCMHTQHNNIKKSNKFTNWRKCALMMNNRAFHKHTQFIYLCHHFHLNKKHDWRAEMSLSVKSFMSGKCTGKLTFNESACNLMTCSGLKMGPWKWPFCKCGQCTSPVISVKKMLFVDSINSYRQDCLFYLSASSCFSTSLSLSLCPLPSPPLSLSPSPPLPSLSLSLSAHLFFLRIHLPCLRFLY